MTNLTLNINLEFIMKTVLKALKIGLVLLITSLALSSCVTAEEIRQQELKQQQEQLQKEEAKIHKKTVLLNQANGNLLALVSRNCINEEEFYKASQHIEKHVNRSFFGKWWFLPVLLLYYFIIVIHAATTETERYKPLNKGSIFFAWLIGGVFGVHIHKLREVPLSEYNDTKSSFFGRKWITVSYLLLFFFFLSIYTPLTTFWTQPKVLFYWVYYYSWMNVNTIWRFVLYISLIMMSVNVLTVICIPYWVYKYNALYFRHHYDNDKILSGQSTSIQIAIENCNSDVELSNQNRVIAMENLEKYNGLRAEDYDDSFIASCARGVSNVFTLGRAGKLRDKQDYLRLLQDSCMRLNTAVDNIEMGAKFIKMALEQCRAAAYRNLYLTKEIIKYLKENYQDQEQELKIDDTLQLNYSTNIVKDSKIANLDVSFDPTDLSESFSKNLECSFSNLNSNLEKKRRCNKGGFYYRRNNFRAKNSS